MLSAPPAFVLSQDQTLKLEFDSKLYLLPFYRKVRSLAFTLSRPESTASIRFYTSCSSLPLYSFQGSLVAVSAATDAILLHPFELVNTFFKVF